jgi:hypothetical protein
VFSVNQRTFAVGEDRKTHSSKIGLSGPPDRVGRNVDPRLAPKSAVRTWGTGRRGFDFVRARKENEHLAELIYYLYGFVFYQARCIRDNDWPTKDCMQWRHLTGVVYWASLLSG